MKEINLKPCPFCGSDAAVVSVVRPDGSTTFGVECKVCQSAARNWFSCPENAATFWNTRAELFTHCRECRSWDQDRSDVFWGECTRTGRHTVASGYCYMAEAKA